MQTDKWKVETFRNARSRFVDNKWIDILTLSQIQMIAAENCYHTVQGRRLTSKTSSSLYFKITSGSRIIAEFQVYQRVGAELYDVCKKKNENK